MAWVFFFIFSLLRGAFTLVQRGGEGCANRGGMIGNDAVAHRPTGRVIGDDVASPTTVYINIPCSFPFLSFPSL